MIGQGTMSLELPPLARFAPRNREFFDCTAHNPIIQVSTIPALVFQLLL